MDKPDNTCTPHGPAPQLPVVSRRQFLKNVGMMAGGAAITSMFVTTGCSSESQANPNNSPNNPTATKTFIRPTFATGEWDGNYEVTILDMPEMEAIPGCTAQVAMDRLYARDHMWVKPIADNIAVIGITERFLAYFEGATMIELQEEGSTLRQDYPLALIEGKKMNVEAICPVSGRVIRNNDHMVANLGPTINSYPYLQGWMQILELTNPEELDGLLSPEEYLYYTAKLIAW